MKYAKPIARITLSIFALWLAYYLYLSITGGFNVDPKTGKKLATDLEKLFMLPLWLGVIATFCLSQVSAWRDGRFGWIFLNFFLVPSLYYLNFVHGKGKNESFKDITKSVNKN